MSGASGGTGIGSGGSSNIALLEGGLATLPSGVQVDLKTAEGVSEARAQLSAGALAELEAAMSQMGFKLVEGAFIPKDTFELRKELGVLGPTSTQEGLGGNDQELIHHVFEQNGTPSPYNANTTEGLYGSVNSNAQFGATVGAGTTYLANPTAGNKAEFVDQIRALKAQYPNGNITELLFLVFRESIKETNEDKKYFLLKLQQFNDMAEGISAYLKELTDASIKLTAQKSGKEEPDKETVAVTVREYDLTTLGPDGKLLEIQAEGTYERVVGIKMNGWRPELIKETLPTNVKYLSGGDIDKQIKNVESMQETIRNKRQMASTAFQNFDQKANQLYNLMASVLKSVNEMRSGITRNMM